MVAGRPPRGAGEFSRVRPDAPGRQTRRSSVGAFSPRVVLLLRRRPSRQAGPGRAIAADGSFLVPYPIVASRILNIGGRISEVGGRRSEVGDGASWRVGRRPP